MHFHDFIIFPWCLFNPFVGFFRQSEKINKPNHNKQSRNVIHRRMKVLAERHYPVTPVYNETRSGVVLNVDGHSFTPEELVAMVLSHAVDISVAYSAESGSPLATVKDVVLTTPMFATVAERRALLDAATLAELNVLTIVDENTAAALHYAMDKQFETPQLLLFYNLGASALQVSLIRFFNYELPQKFGKPKTVPGFEILAKAWDETLGGNAFDHVIVDKLLAEPFNAAWWASKPEHAGKDVRDVPRAMTKFRLQANKIKHVLSANNDIPVHMDSVHDDVSLSLTITREQFEKHADALFERALQPIAKVLAMANCTIANLTGTELVGGGMRIPKVQQKLQEYLGENLELGLHINADESFALGAAFAGANISTAFRVRHVGMTDINPFSMKVSLENLKTDDEKTSTYDEEKNAWAKQAVIFKENGKLGVKKTIAFTHDRDVHCGLDYVESIDLPTGTELGLSRYNITGVAEFAAEMKEKGLGIPKVSLQFELSASGIPNLVRAEAAVEETYTVQEEVEVEDDGSDTDNSTDAIVDKSDATEETDTSEDKKEESDEKTNETDSSSNLSANETDSVEKPKKKRIMVEKVCLG
jgi:hypoxia up-regulated 1